MNASRIFYLVVVPVCIALSACNQKSTETESSYLDREMVVYESNDELIDYLKKVNEFNKLDKAYRLENFYLSEVEVYSKKLEKFPSYGSYEEIVVTGTRATIQDSIGSKVISTQIVDGLSADEIGDIPALSIGEALETVTGASSEKEESITNNQEKNVDQGDIIKRLGDYLIVLRKGVIHSLRVSQKSSKEMELVSKVDLQGSVKTHGAWYDELLVLDNLVVVIGYSYGKHDGTEIVLFDMDDFGKITLNQRYFIESDDYYDSENSATRIIGNDLVMVVPSYILPGDFIDSVDADENLKFPAVRYLGDSTFAEEINIADQWKWINSGNKDYSSLEVVNVLNCPLDNINSESLKCRITSLLGVSGYGSEFYVSPDAVYIWANHEPSLNYQKVPLVGYEEFIRSPEAQKLQEELLEIEDRNAIYRVGLQDSKVGTVAVDGYALNQYSFQQRGDVFSGVSTKYKDEKELVDGITFNIDKFTLSQNELPESAYKNLIQSDVSYVSANRFMGDLAFLANNENSSSDDVSRSIVVWDRGSNEVTDVDGAFMITAFHPQGHNMLAMGRDDEGRLALQTVSIKPKIESLEPKYFEKYSPSESRSVAFNSRRHGSGSLFGIPVDQLDEEGNITYYESVDNVKQRLIDIIYFENSENHEIKEIGQLKAKEESVEENCIVSCDEWYGVARPFFIGDYIYALMDDEVVKGHFSAGQVKTINRLNIVNGQVSFE